LSMVTTGQTAIAEEITPNEAPSERTSGRTLPGSLFQIGERSLVITYWVLGILLAVIQSWTYRYATTADAVQYLDMSDGVLSTSNWHRLINGVWSPLYAVVLGFGQMLHPSRYGEIVTAHYVGVIIFIFTFGCFEFFLRSLAYPEKGSESTHRAGFPRLALLSIAYTIFLWSSISQVTFKSLRPDMLMDGFLFLAVGLLVRITRGKTTWFNFLALGAVLGVGYLAKAPMLVTGLVMLATTLTQWRRVLVKAVAAGALMLAIGSLYFVPLSQQLGRFSLGESSSYNYLYHVDRATPSMYLSNPGRGEGTFLRTPPKIYNAPPAYEFHYALPAAHSLRFDPIYWTEGVKPRFSLNGQFWILVENFGVYAQILGTAGGIMLGVLLLFLLSGPARIALRDVARNWPVWILGIFGLVMYLAVHVEDRYAGGFFTLLWLGLIAGMRVREDFGQKIVPGIALAMALAVLGPILLDNVSELIQQRRATAIDHDGQAAMQLQQLGFEPGTPVARISSYGVDLGWARLARARVVAEVDIDRADDFWSAGEQTQNEILQAFAKTGAKIVVAHLRGSMAPAGWQRLGKTYFWMHRLS
jgi:hypothetical protein